mgnify:CR=1 FL=1
MTHLVKAKIAKIERTWVRIVLFSAFSAAMLLNSMNTKLPLIGILTSLVAVYIGSVATGEVFFPREKRFLRQALGLVAFVVILTLLGTFLILTMQFTEIFSLVGFIAVGLVLCVLSVLRKPVQAENVSEHENKKSKKKEDYSLVFLFLLSVAIAFYALLHARTGEGVTSVWLTIPNIFLPVFFLSSLSLVIILFFTEMNVGLKLAFVSVHSFLSHSLFSIVWYPGRYGDIWSHLGAARFIDKTGTFYAHQWLFSQHLIADIVKYKSQYALVALFRRMFSLDIYWVHIFFIPLLWSIFVPILSYKLAEVMTSKKDKTFPLLTAISVGLFAPLTIWGAVSVPNSLGFIFLLLSIVLLVYWVDTLSKRILLLSILASVATFFAHPQTGIFAFIFLSGAVIIESKLPSILKVVLFPLISSGYLYISYLQNAAFSQVGLLSLENVLSFQVDITTLMLVFGFLGMVFSIRGELVKGRIAFLLFLFYVTTAAIYYVSMYGMINSPVPQRMLLMLYPLLVPFVALGLMVTVSFLKAGFSRVKANTLKKMASPHSVALVIICLLLSSQTTLALYQAYPREEITKVQPAAYEVEAIHYIDLTSPGRYIVLADTNFAALGVGLLGTDYAYGAVARGTYGIPEWGWWTMKFFSDMARNPSISVLEGAMIKARAGVCYFVVSIRESDYENIVRRTSKVLPVDNVFGDGKLTVFKYVSTIVPISGSGPKVKVTFDDGTSTEVQSTFNYFVKSEVKFNITVSGHSSYNISDYPMYWTFFSLKVNEENVQFGQSSDVNSFIYIGGLDPNDVLEVTWRANDHYPYAGWKDDSFKTEWRAHPAYPGTIKPNITNNGNVLSISWDFTSGPYQYYYYVKPCNVSTDDYPYVLVRWKSTGPVATVYAYFEDGNEEVVTSGSQGIEWATTIIKLVPGKHVMYMMVGITNIKNVKISGIMGVSVDYILLCASAQI